MNTFKELTEGFFQGALKMHTHFLNIVNKTDFKFETTKDHKNLNDKTVVENTYTNEKVIKMHFTCTPFTKISMSVLVENNEVKTSIVNHLTKRSLKIQVPLFEFESKDTIEKFNKRIALVKNSAPKAKKNKLVQQ